MKRLAVTLCAICTFLALMASSVSATSSQSYLSILESQLLKSQITVNPSDSLTDRILHISENDREIRSLLRMALDKEAIAHKAGEITYRQVPIDIANSTSKRGVGILEVSEDDLEQVLKYEIGELRVTLHFYNDGKVVKTVVKYNSDGSFEYFENFNNEKLSQVDSNNLPLIRYENLDDKQKNQVQLLASAKIVDPHKINNIPKYETSALLMYGLTRYFSALDDLGYSPNRLVKVYESQKHFSEKSRTSTIIDAYSHIDLAASWWNIDSIKAKNFYNLAGVLLDTYSFIQEKTEPIREHEYSFYGGIEVTVHDPTMHNSDVEVINNWGTGYYTLVFQRVYNGFANATWGISAIPWPLNTSYSDYIDEAQQIYNTNIAVYGYWKHGKGQLGY